MRCSLLGGDSEEPGGDSGCYSSGLPIPVSSLCQGPTPRAPLTAVLELKYPRKLQLSAAIVSSASTLDGLPVGNLNPTHILGGYMGTLKPVALTFSIIHRGSSHVSDGKTEATEARQ